MVIIIIIIINKKKKKRKSTKKRRTCEIVNFAVPADHRIKLKDSKKKDKYHDLARELKNMEHGDNYTFGTVTKEL